LEAIATAKHPVLVIIHLQKQLSQRLQFNIGHANGNQPRRWKPFYQLNTFSWLYFTFKNNFRNGSNCKLSMAIATVNQWGY